MKLATGTAAGQLLVICAAPILTRLYTPADFGTLAVFAALLSIVVPATSMRYELAIPLADTSATALAVLTVCFVSTVLVSSAVGLGMLFGGGALVDALGSPALRQYLWLLPVALTLGGLYQAVSYWAVRVGAFGALARTKISQAAALIVLQVGIGAVVAGPAGLLIGQTAGQGTGAFSLSLSTLRGRRPLHGASMSSLWTVAMRYRRFPLYATPASLMNSTALLVPALLLSATYGPTTAGLYALADRVARLPITVIAASVAQVYISRAGEVVRAAGNIRALYLSTTKRLVVISAPLALGFAVLSPIVFPTLFGEEWELAGWFTAALSVAVACQLVVNPLSATLNVLERQPTLFVLDSCRLAATVISVILPYELGFSNTVAVCCYAAVMTVFQVTYWVVAYLATAGTSGRQG